MTEAEPTVEQVWERSLAIFGNELVRWPLIGPRKLIRLAVRDHYIDPPGIPELCRLDYLATMTPILAFLTCAPNGHDDSQWPPCTPSEFATQMKAGLHAHFHRFVNLTRIHPKDVPNPNDTVH